MNLINPINKNLDKNVLHLDLVFIFICALLGLIISFYIAPRGRDFENYEEYYKSLTSLYTNTSAERFEFGFDFLARCLTIIFPSYTQILYIVIIPFSLYLKYYLIRKCEINNTYSIFAIFFLYLITFAFVLEFNQLRAAIAISLGYLGILLFAKKNLALSILAFLLAFSMHYSSVVFLMGYGCVYLTYRGKVKLLFILITVFCIISKFLVVIIENLNPIAAEYSKNYEQANFGFTSVTLLLAIAYLVYHAFNLKNESKFSVSLIMFLYGGVLFSVVMSSIPVYATRILELTEVGILFVTATKKYNNYYDYGSLVVMFIVVFHKFIAYTIVNPLLNY